MRYVYAPIRFIRAAAIITLFALTWAAGKITRRGSKLSGPVRLRLTLERLGGAWVKLGQMLALRYDILPRAYCDELFTLLNSLKPVAYWRMRKVIVRDFGQPPEVLFHEFDEVPFATASVGQVHRAVTLNGHVVAVKIQRPGVRRSIQGDMLLMYFLASLLDLSPLPVTGLRPIVGEFVRWTTEELDFRNEARHAQRLRALGEGDPTQYVPAVAAALSSRRVLTAELVSGISVAEINAPPTRLSASDREATAHRFLWSMLNQIYGDGFFQADPHPANVLALADHRVAFLDFGIVGQLDDRIRLSVNAFAESILLGDHPRAAAEFATWLTPPDEARDAIPELIEVLEGYTAVPDGDPGVDAVPLTFELRMMDVVRRRQLTVDPRFVRYTKAVVTARGTAALIAPDFDVRPYELSFFLRKRQMTLEQALRPAQLIQWAARTAQRIDGALDTLQQLADTTTRVESEAGRASRQFQALAVLALAGTLSLLVYLFATPNAIRHGRVAIVVGAIAVAVLALVILVRARRLPKVIKARRW